MGALTIVAIVLSSVLLYLMIGWKLAKRDLPNAWVRARKRWNEYMARDSVKWQTAAMVMGWPILGLIRYLIKIFSEAITEYDPQEAERKAKEREREQQEAIEEGKATIARLERELGVEPVDTKEER